MAPVWCKPEEWFCNVTQQCLSAETRCDRVVDCPDQSDESGCRCVDYLIRSDSHKHKVCDGIMDCMDHTDETNCPRCGEDMFVCRGVQSQCVNMSKVCDGENDCINGDDETNCITLYQNPMDDIGRNYNAEGVLYIRHHGQWAPMCFDGYDLDSTNQIHQNVSLLNSLHIDDMGQAVCKANYYSQLDSVQIESAPKLPDSNFFSISSNVSTDLKPALSL